MSSYFDRETQLSDDERPDTEFTLSTASLLGIFFGLVLVCGVFFGFGYSVGRRSAADKPSDRPEVKSAVKPAVKSEPSAPAPSVTTTVTNQDAADSHPKPPASQQLPAPAVAPSVASPIGAKAGARTAATQGTSAASPQPMLKKADAGTPARPSPAKPQVAESSAAAAPSRMPGYGALGVPGSAARPSQTTSPQTANTNTQTGAPQATVVQIAAVSHQEDADVLITALKKRGYNVGIRREPQDQLMHVQVGPFSSRADAVAMRQKLLADGYNAIVKP